MAKSRRPRAHERSAGAVVYHDGPHAREILLLRYGSGHWGFPKGHVEPGETDLEAAQREVTEETSIPPERQHVIEGFHDRTDYNFRRGRTTVHKEVEFFIVESSTREVRLSHEHTEYIWVPYEQALARVTFEGPRRVLRAAWEFLQRRELRENQGADSAEAVPQEP